MKAEQKEHNQNLYIFGNNNMHFVVIRQIISPEIDNLLKEYQENSKKKKKYSKKTILVFDFWNLNDSIESNDSIFSNLLYTILPKSIVIKHCVIKEIFNLYNRKIPLELEGLYITDELYSMSPNLSILFNNIKTKKLLVKKIKINSKKQLSNFFDFIKKTECEELILNDIFIELLIKENENDDNELKQYFSLKNGKIILKNDENKEDEPYTKIEHLKLIDSPLFALPEEDSFSKIIKNENISIDIDENSLLNPDIITKFKIKGGLLDICYDLDSYKLNNEEDNENEDQKDKDYLEYIKYIFDIILNNTKNYRKIKFKNFDINKIEYIFKDNYTKTKEENWILNKEEKERKEKYEKFDKEIREKIKDIKLENIKELIFDNCTNHFIELILSMIETDLDLLKIKKCAKEYFNMDNIFKLNIKHLYLFDTPIFFGLLKKDEIKEEKLTLKIVSLEHYCHENNLDFYVVMEKIRDLVNGTQRDCICFEMNALPMLMTFLISEKYYLNTEKNAQKEIQTYFPKNQASIDKTNNDNADKMEINEYRTGWAVKSTKFNNLKTKTIILKRNNIRNNFENFHFFRNKFNEIKGEDKHRKGLTDFGRDIAYLDFDYNSFFKVNNIDKITLENCLFSNYKNLLFQSEEAVRQIKQKVKETIYNFMDEEGRKKKVYYMDMKTLKEIVLKNNSIEDFALIMKVCSQMKELFDAGKKTEINNVEKSKKVINFFRRLKGIFQNIINKTVIITINNIIELKELYCLIVLLSESIVVEPKKNETKELGEGGGKDKDKEIIEYPKGWSYELIKNYFVKEKNEEDKDIYTIFNYYYESDNERNRFGTVEKGIRKKIEVPGNADIKFEIICNFDDRWNILFE